MACRRVSVVSARLSEQESFSGLVPDTADAYDGRLIFIYRKNIYIKSWLLKESASFFFFNLIVVFHSDHRTVLTQKIYLITLKVHF